MITGELKSKIDKIWDTIWTAGISSPSTVLEQITYLIFMKLLDDNETKKEGNAAALGFPYKSKIFKDGLYTPDDGNTSISYNELRWKNFHNAEPGVMFETVRNFVFPFIKTVNGEGKDTAFSRFMSDAVFMLPTPKVLAVCVDTLSEIDMSNKDIMGDVYEYCLLLMSSAGALGQFRTPRHIVDMMVQLVRPTLSDKVLDPAMGSAGFLLGCASYLNENNSSELLNKTNADHFNKTMFYGYDTDPTMLRIGAMNMLLHGVEEPNIERKDSLSDDNTVREEYSLILANPPFTGSVFQEDISKDILALCKTKKTELLFLALFIKSLKLGGRCACIVPDGVLFGSSTAHKSIRKELIENNCLQAVISMPSGVFKPYAGVSTAVLVFKKDPSGTKDVWFYDMKADGKTLDDKRTDINENDIPDIIARFHNPDGEKERARTEQSFFVDKQDIVNNDYDLSINKYTSGISSRQRIINESTKFDREKFEDATHFQPIKLTIDHESGEVIGHEGRHRMVALSNEGIRSVPVLLFDSSNKYDKSVLNDFKLIGQFNEYSSETVGEANIYVDSKIADVYERLNTKIGGLEAQICHQAVVNAQVTANISCMQNAINVLNGLTKTVIPIGNVCPSPMPEFNSWTAPTASTTGA